jgi:putative nucleotidyltransferase with HDIG domain
MPEEQSATSAPGQLSAFVPFDLQGFPPNRPPMVDIYHRMSNRYVLICSAQAVFSRATKQRLLDGGVRVLYARLTSSGISDGGLAVPELVDMPDERLPLSVKAGLLYHSAISATRQTLAGIPIADRDISSLCEFVGSIAIQLSRNQETVQALLALMRHDTFVFVHSVNVAIYSTMLATQMGLPQEQIGTLSRAAFLHDVGKTRIPSEVLNKNGALTRDEWALVRKHPEWGIEMLRSLTDKDQLLREIILQHHERLDGNGYPRGLKAAEIHPLARVIALADAFDALTSEKPYRPAVHPREALRVVKKEDIPGALDRDIFVSLVRMLDVPNEDEFVGN